MTSGAPVPAPVESADLSTRRAGGTSRLAAFVIRLPDILAVLALAAIVAVAIPVQLGVFHPWVVAPLFVVAAVGALALLPTIPTRRVVADRWWVIGTVLVLLVAVSWFLVNRGYSSQLLSIRRDPSIYTLRGIWLMDHASPNTELSQDFLNLRKAVPDLSLYQGGETGKTERYLQSTTIVPGLIAVAGWIGGITWLLQANVLIGAGALVAVYTIARRLAGPLFGLIPVAALAVSMPLMAFSRAPYTEPLSLLAVSVGALGLLWGARGGGRRGWLLGGIGIGLAAVTRIDGLLVVIGAVIGIGACVALAVGRERRREMGAALLWFGIGAVPTTLLGLTDLLLNSPDYLHVLRTQALALWLALGFATLVAIAVRWLPAAVREWAASHRRRLAAVVSALAGLVVVVLAARPLFLTSRHTIEPYATEVRIRQQRQGLPIDPTRAYDEQTITWLAWYFGWAVVIAGAVCAVVLVWQMIARRRRDLLIAIAPMGFSLVYLVRAQITPDQVWAMRRFLPSVIPGILLVLGWGLAVGATGLARRFRERTTPIFAAALALSAVVVIVPAALTTRPMFPVKEGDGQLAFVQQICAQLPTDKVAVLGPIPVMGYYQVTLRNLCGVDTVALRAPTAAKLAALDKAWGGGVTAVVFDDTGLPWADGEPPAAPDVSVGYEMWDTPLGHPPTAAVRESTVAYLGTIAANGEVVPLHRP